MTTMITMTTPSAHAPGLLPALPTLSTLPAINAINQMVSSDFLALASHMKDCNRSRGRFFTLRSSLETLHATASPRIVTTATVLLLCGAGLLAFA